MPGPENPETPPPDLPEEFAAAYREAYQRSLEGEAPAPEPADDDPFEYLFAGSTSSVEPEPEPYLGAEPPRWRTAVWLGVAALLVLLLAGYGLGRMLGGDDDPGPSAAPDDTTSPTATATTSQSTPTPSATATGELVPVLATSADASCTAPPSVDAAGNEVSYPATNAIDADDTTAWRCVGDGDGVRLIFNLPEDTRIGEVGIVPGYAKTDPANGVDRYAENNRITLVRWTFADGVTVEQQLNPDPSKRELQTVPVPVTVTGTVELEILEVDRGRRNTTAISTVAFSAPAD